MDAKSKLHRRTGRILGKDGFTLVELVVASGITIFLVSLLVAMISTVTSGWQRIQGSLSAEAQARLILDQMASDLQGALFKPNGATWLAFSVVTTAPADAYLDAHGWQRTVRTALPSHTVLLKPGSDDPDTLTLDAWDLADCRYGQSGGWLRFFTTYQDRNDSIGSLSAPTAVAYQIVRRNVSGEINNNPATNPAEIRYQFFRSVVRATGSSSTEQSKGSFEVGFDLSQPPYSIASGTEGNPGTITRPNGASLLANNVIDFGVRLFVREGSDLRLVYPVDPLGGLGSHLVDPDHLANSNDLTDGGRFPDLVEIMVRILTDEGAREIQNLEAGRIEGDWWEIAEANSRVFTRRIATLAQFPTP